MSNYEKEKEEGGIAMPWTNVTIPNQFSNESRMQEEILLLKFKLERLGSRNDRLYDELDNIFRALKEYKEISICNGKEEIKARLVEGKKE